METGTTLRAAGMEVFGEEILESEAVLIRGDRPSPAALEILDRRIEGVLVARQYVMCDYDCPAANLAEAVELTPGLQSPTISPLHEAGWYAVRSMVETGDVNRVMDDLYRIGARGIIVTPVLACRI